MMRSFLLAACVMAAGIALAAPVPQARPKAPVPATYPPVGRCVVVWNGSDWDTVIADGYWWHKNGECLYKGSCGWNPVTRVFTVNESRDGETWHKYHFVLDQELKGEYQGTRIEIRAAGLLPAPKK